MLIIMMTENHSMLVHFQRLCRTLNWNSLKFSLYWKIHSLDGLLKQGSARKYFATWNQKIWMHWFLCVLLPCIADFSASAELFPSQIRVSWPPEYTWSTARAEKTATQAWEVDFQKDPRNASGGATPCIAAILANPDPFLARIRVSWPPEYTWSTVKAEIAPPCRPIIAYAADFESGSLLLLERHIDLCGYLGIN